MFDSNKIPYFPRVSWDSVIGLDKHNNEYLTNWITLDNNKPLLFNSIKEQLQLWHDQLPEKIYTNIKMQSPNGTVFLLSVSDNGQPVFTKEDDANGES